MNFLRSIRWRLQLWHGVILLTVLLGFGVTAYRLEEANEWRRVDAELRQRLQAVHDSLRRPPPGPPPEEEPPPRGFPDLPRQGHPETPPPPRSFRIIPDRASLFASETNGFYYILWLRDGRELTRSGGAPRDCPAPERSHQLRPGSTARLRGSVREAYDFTPPGECLLVGRSVAVEQASLSQLALGFVALGGTVLALGLAGGSGLAARAIRPIDDISAAATRIATGDLSRRIDTTETDNELGRLAVVLNSAFSRLEAAAHQQSQFAADASHELRTPVSVILTQTQLALSRDRDTAEYRATLEACQRSAQRMRRLIDSLLTLARMDAGQEPMKMEPLDLEVVIQEALPLIEPLASDRGIQIHTQLVSIQCHGNAERLTQLLINLLGNAVAHHNKPGTGEVRITLAADDRMATLTIADNGPGIAVEHLSKIFERFYRVDVSRTAATGGSGLGLSMVKAIVDAHGGQVIVHSNPIPGATQGSQVIVQLPL